MPENGVFHNLIIAKIKTRYPGHAQQIMHAFWGIGQMSFVKHALFVGKGAPKLTDYNAITKYILNRLNIDNILITQGILDALDHSSDNFAYGSKLGIDCTGDEIEDESTEEISKEELLQKFQKIDKNVTSLNQYYKDTKNHITLLKINKKYCIKEFFNKIDNLLKFIKILIVLDEDKNNLDNLYMVVWRITNNIDAKRDIIFRGKKILIDATNKTKFDNFQRKWPEDVLCDKHVLENLRIKNIIEFDKEYIKYNFY
jgi:4-hydroxy-3-polyprenylbenzoate decarboxylase